ncbi:MAG: hypothetical protein MI724_10945, partial [Spirochaetales bacterium]|nr:hypothetical protein [Spirochaetales bacterium]
MAFPLGPEAISLDFHAGSVGADLGFSTTVERIVLRPTSPVHRVQSDHLRVYTAGATQEYVEAVGWHARTLLDGSIEIGFDGVAPTARYVKVHATFDERATDLTPVNAGEFSNTPGEIITVYVSTTVQAEEGFVYDDAGNRIQEIDITGGVSAVHASTYYGNDRSQRLKSNGASGDNGRFGFVYDGNGNMTARGTHYTEPTPDQLVIDTAMGERWSYEWDLANRLTGVSRNGTTVANYIYSGRGLRVRKVGTSG